MRDRGRVPLAGVSQVMRPDPAPVKHAKADGLSPLPPDRRRRRGAVRRWRSLDTAGRRSERLRASRWRASESGSASSSRPLPDVQYRSRRDGTRRAPSAAGTHYSVGVGGGPSTGPFDDVPGERDMSYAVDFVNVSTIGLESSPVATALAGLRANEARYFKNKYDHVFTVEPAAKAKKAIDWVHRVLKEERDIAIASPPLEATTFQVENIGWTYVFYESGLSINMLYPLDEPKKRAVGFKLSEGMDVPDELGSFKFARQKSKLAGTIRGSYFVIKGEY